jgi:hypothetical protein
MTVQNNNHIIALRFLIIGSIGIVLLFFFLRIYDQLMPHGVYQNPFISALYELSWIPIVLSIILMPLLWGIVYYKKQLSPKVTIPFFIVSTFTLLTMFFWDSILTLF